MNNSLSLIFKERNGNCLFLRMTFLFLLFVVTGIMNICAQPYLREIESIHVTAEGDTIAQPFAGGIDGPNHRFVDIDGDSDFDLFIFDADLNFDFYRNEGTAQNPVFKLRPNEIPFPAFSAWFLFIDLNGDSKIDLVTDNGGNSLSYYTNNGSIEEPNFVLHSSPVLDTSGNPIIGGFLGIPAFTDIDADGDYDFFSSNFDGSLTLYENIGTAAEPSFRFADGMYQSVVIVNDSCKKGFAATPMNVSARHGGSILLFEDINDDKAPDLLMGDMNSRKLFFIPNMGDSSAADFQCFEGNFPHDNYSLPSVYNEPNLIDIDGDGDLDLFIGGFINMGASNMQRRSFWYYENTGSPLEPNLTLVTKEFISTLDVGRQARPVIFDVNNDGLQDMLIGNVNGQLWYYQNSGTLTQPEFTLMDTLFAGIRGSFSYAPSLTDIDGDGDDDLGIGRFDGKIMFYRNNNATTAPYFEGQAFDSVATGQSNVVAPAFTDIDGDSDYDMFVGMANGRIRLYRNIGNETAFQFSLINSFYDSIDVGENANPLFFDADGDTDDDMFIGNASGKLFFYENVGARFEYRTDLYGTIQPLKESAPAFADIDHDGDDDLFIGTFKGGVHFYRNMAPNAVDEPAGGVPLPSEYMLEQNYPNPFNPATVIRYRLPVRSYVTLKVFNILGAEAATLVDGVQEPGIKTVEWSPKDMPGGVYICRLTAGNITEVSKMLLMK